MTKFFRNRTSAPTKLFIVVLVVLALLPWGAAVHAVEESPRTLAVADFALYTPAEAAGQYTWLGAALAELLQAKMQFFSGTRVVERTRLRPLLTAAHKEVTGDLDDLPDRLNLVPAEILIAGSVSVAPGKDPARIKVQARAFETETAKIISEATFSGKTDLAGLLRIAEDLAKTIAVGLKLGCSSEQLAYAEPARVEALKFFVEGEEHVRAGRHREAVAAYQKALEGNAGTYYPAAHRAQGEAYQLLAKSQPESEARKVKEEYLKKFKEDALAAAGAFWDLGLAYEVNGLWKEAEGAYRDYLAAVGPEGELVRWRLRYQENLRLRAQPDGLYFEGEKFIHLVPGARMVTHKGSATRWISLDATTGKVVREVDLNKLGRDLGEAGPTHFYPIGFKEGRAFFRWAALKIGGREEGVQFERVHVLALGPALEPLWKYPLPETMQYTALHNGRVFLISQGALLTLDAADGRLLSRIPSLERSVVSGFADLAGLDLEGASFTTRAGEVYDLNSGRIVEHYEKDRILWPTGRRDVAYLRERDGIRLSSKGREPFFIGDVGALISPGVLPSGDRPSRETSTPPAPSAGPLVFGSSRGYKIVNPETGEAAPLFTDVAAPELPAMVGTSSSTLVFLDEAPPKEIETRHIWGGIPERKIIRLNVFEASGRFLGKRNLDLEDLNDWPYRIFPVEGDIVYSGTGGLTRVKAAAHRGLEIVPAAVAHLRIGYCRLRQGDPTGAIAAAGRFEAEFPQDYRGLLLRIEEAVSRGADGEAGQLAVRALGSGELDEGEREHCLRQLKKIHPEVQRVIATATRRQLKFHSWAGDGILVCDAGPATGRASYLLVDAGSGRTRRVDPVGFSSPMAFLHRGEYLYGLPGGGQRILRFNLLTGEKLFSPDYPISQNRWRIPGVEVGALRVRVNEPWELVTFDPQTLAILSTTSLGRAGPNLRFSGNDTVVFVEPLAYEDKVPEKTPEVLVLDRLSGRELGRFLVPLRQEVLRGVAADRSALCLTVAGADWDTFEAGGKGLWYRVLSFPLANGGAAWTYENEGWLAGNPVLKEDEVYFPAFEGHLAAASFGINLFSKIKEAILSAGPPISRIRLERRTGTRLSGDLLPGNPWDDSPRRRGSIILPAPNPESWVNSLFHDVGGWSSPRAPLRLLAGRTETVKDDYREYWSPAPGARPVQVAPESLDQEYKVDISSGFKNLQLFRQDTVYESIGGGVVLIKDLAAGKGRENIAPYGGY